MSSQWPPLQDGQPKYVTALGASDQAEGWREGKAHGGVLIDVPSGEIVARRLSMPHSPQLQGNRLWALDSGRGRLVTIDLADGHVEEVAQLPGYTRGLALFDHYAPVGLSKIRETSTFGGVPIAEKRDELRCGVWLVDVRTGEPATIVEFKAGVAEVFDVALLIGLRFPAQIGREQ